MKSIKIIETNDSDDKTIGNSNERIQLSDQINSFFIYISMNISYFEAFSSAIKLSANDNKLGFRFSACSATK